MVWNKFPASFVQLFLLKMVTNLIFFAEGNVYYCESANICLFINIMQFIHLLVYFAAPKKLAFRLSYSLYISELYFDVAVF